MVPNGLSPSNLGALFPAPLLVDADTGATRLVLRGGFKLLGAPIGAKGYCEEFTRRRADKAKPALEALANLHPQVGLLRLRYCASYSNCPNRTACPALGRDAGLRGPAT